jgi:hypothetical protein
MPEQSLPFSRSIRRMNFPEEIPLKKIRLVLAIALALSGMRPALAQDRKFTDRLLKNRYQLTVQDGVLAGSGVPVLQKAVSDAQFVLIGEDHGIAQIPQFVGAVCHMTEPQGFLNLAVETGPLAAGELQKWITRDDGRTQLVAFEKQFPETIAFYNFQEEFDMLSRCAHAAPGGTLHLWGLDQELMGASNYILTQIMTTAPGKDASDLAQLLLQKSDQAHAVSAKSGSPADTYMMTASDADLVKLRDLLQKQGSPKAQLLIAELIESREIYQKNMNGSGYDSNRQRALLMKRNFIEGYRAATELEGHAPRVLMKFGGEHTYKGFNPLRNNDLGNLISELADSAGSQSVHILILGVKGSQLRFAGIGRPFQPATFNLVEDKDSDFRFLKPMFDNLENDGWTMFDLRGLRKGFPALGPVDKELERLVFGNDLLVLIPNAMPSKQIR